MFVRMFVWVRQIAAVYHTIPYGGIEKRSVQAFDLVRLAFFERRKLDDRKPAFSPKSESIHPIQIQSSHEMFVPNLKSERFSLSESFKSLMLSCISSLSVIN